MRYIIILAVAFMLSGCASMGMKNSRLNYAMAHASELTLDQRVAIEQGEIKRGFTKDMVRASWGSPCGYCYGTTHNSWGDSWEYNVFGTGSMGIGQGTIVYFEEGRVTGWSGP